MQQMLQSYDIGGLAHHTHHSGEPIKEEEVDLSDYKDLANARQEISHFLEEVYQRKRIHSALGYLTPSEFEAAYFKEQSEADPSP